MSKVWVLSEAYYPEERATGYLLTQIAERLAQTQDVGVITGPATKGEEVVEAPRHTVRNGVEIHRGPGTDFNRHSLVGRVTNWLTRAVPMVVQATWRVESDDTVVVVTNPPTLPYLTFLVKWLTGCKIALLVHDMYPEVLPVSGVVNEDSKLVQVWDRASRLLYEQVDHVITLGRDMTHLIADKLNDDASKITRIPNWAENDLIEPEPRSENAILRERSLTDSFVVLFAGNHGRTHGLEYLASAAEHFDKLKEEVHFLFAGYGAKKEWLESYVSSRGLENVTSLGSYPRSEQKTYLNAGDLAIISLIPGMTGISVPSRLYNHMAAGTPILAVADERTELALVVQEEEIGWTVRPENTKKIVDSIRYAKENPDECREKGERAWEVAKKKYTLENVLSDYKRVISSI
ncbi:glycosyltransferase family 4 protein [Salinibacter ruber]|uniref:glycosyltransferase family 4 protein n=1 Tax=Salinibacter ruber TaxID=146919 RepID=UPI0020732C6B|nr:glycosyltransferase family 4 protein [Salinibacter ruber]MCS4114607.1 glycosyltransferase involved in cell wall biosynthesis [Salinibacter ruber]MCS4181760.1 glycosyltransferase involved in cell wall biosynthesis [Salinibacter ruber]